jgi:hypothetical protein
LPWHRFRIIVARAAPLAIAAAGHDEQCDEKERQSDGVTAIHA